MLVIEGRSGKAIALIDWFKNEYRGDLNKVLIINNQKNTLDFTDIDVSFLELKGTSSELINKIFVQKGEDITDTYDWIVFYTNIDKDNLKLFKDLDKEITQNIIVTVQSDEVGLVYKYFL